MNYLPLYLVYNPPHETLGEKITLCGEMLLRGMGTVFLVLMILWGIIELFNYVSTSGERAAKAKKAKAAEPTPAEPAPVFPNKPAEPAEALPETVESDNGVVDGAVIAAIMAAVEAYRAGEGKASLPYRVVSFRRKNTTKR